MTSRAVALGLGIVVLTNLWVTYAGAVIIFTISASDNSKSIVVPVFLAWVFKSILMRFGGMTLYRRATPIFLGLLSGYTFGVVWCFVIDIVWFPGHGHKVHSW